LRVGGRGQAGVVADFCAHQWHAVLVRVGVAEEVADWRDDRGFKQVVEEFMRLADVLRAFRDGEGVVPQRRALFR